MATLNDLRLPYVIDLNQNQNIEQNRQVTPKIISFYAEKGGVGKTTNCLALAFGFAQNGSRVLIYDCDVQRSLTAWAFGINIELNHGNTVNKVDNFIRSLPAPEGMHKTLFEQVDAKTFGVEPAFATSIRENIYIVAGDRRTPKLDSIILVIETFCSKIQGSVSNNRTARPYHAIMKTAECYKADFVFLDLNPYPSTLNRCLIMSSNYILIPLCLDAFCLEMINMMETNLTNWKKEIDSAKEFINMPGNNMTWPEHLPKFLGYIINLVMVYGNDVIRKNEIYLKEEINNQAKNLTKKLGDNRTRNSLAITSKQYDETNTTECLGMVKEYHGLGDISDIFRLPVPFLNESHFYRYHTDQLFYRVDQNETVKKRNQVNKFIESYNEIIINILKLIHIDGSN